MNMENNSITELNQVISAALKNVPEQYQMSAQQNIPYIVKALQDEGILTPNILAYALATVQHETGGTFKPIEEYGGRQQAKRLGYSGGEDYFGRGYIQITHDYNYKDIGNQIGLGDALVKNPALALQPDVAARVLAKFFKDRGVAELAETGDFYRARGPVNGSDRAADIAARAQGFQAALPKQFTAVTPTPLPTQAPGQRPLWQRFMDRITNGMSVQAEEPSGGFSTNTPVTPNPSTFFNNKGTSSAGGFSVNAPMTPNPSTYSSNTYSIKPGDTLWSIAERTLGSGSQWKNLGYTGDPRQLPVGGRITVPRPTVQTPVPQIPRSTQPNKPFAIATNKSGGVSYSDGTVKAQTPRPTPVPTPTFPKSVPATPVSNRNAITNNQKSKPFPIGTHKSGKTMYSDGSIR
jgi:predicted chitinase/LysM repeat protein